MRSLWVLGLERVKRTKALTHGLYFMDQMSFIQGCCFALLTIANTSFSSKMYYTYPNSVVSFCRNTALPSLILPLSVGRKPQPAKFSPVWGRCQVFRLKEKSLQKLKKNERGGQVSHLKHVFALTILPWSITGDLG